MPKTKEATILFADMVDSSTLSHIHDPNTYDKLVYDFQRTAAEVVKEILNESKTPGAHFEAAVRGDELSLIMTTSRHPDRSADSDEVNRRFVALALQIAVNLKRRWLLVPRNRKRVEVGQPPLGIAIGIHAGPVVVDKHLRFEAGTLEIHELETAEGYAINLAKRVETASRLGRFSRVFLTRPIYNRTPSDFRQAFVRVDVPQLKGLPVVPLIYEAKGIGHFDDKAFTQGKEFDEDKNIEIYEDIVRANPNEIWLLLDLAHKYFDSGQYRKAAQKYKSVIEVDENFAPAHAYLGRSYFRDYQLSEAQASLERAVELNPGQARANNYLAVCLRRQAIISLLQEQRDEARNLFQKAVYHHDRARRVSAGEGELGYFWARNALNWTIAQCHCIKPRISLPYDLETAYDKAQLLHSKIVKNDQWSAKRHLTFHTMGFIRLVQQHWGQAKNYLNEAKDALKERKTATPEQLRPDDKGYAERKAEILYHIGLCQLHDPPREEAAILSWKEAQEEIKKAWGDQADRAFDGQYWMNDRPISPEKKTIRELIS